jgi:hypothetical protein
MKLRTDKTIADVYIDQYFAKATFVNDEQKLQTVYAMRVWINGDVPAFVLTPSRKVRDLVHGKWFTSKVDMGAYLALKAFYEDGEIESEDMETDTTSVYTFDEFVETSYED